MGQSSFKNENRQLLFVVICILFSSSFFSTAFLDPVNWPKQIALFSFLPVLFFALLPNLEFPKPLWRGPFRTLHIYILSIVLILIIAFVDDTDITRKIWGVFGRNNGLVTTLSLLFIGLTISQFRWNSISILLVLKAISFSTSISAVYGLVQFLKIDPFPWNIKDQVFSFYGNTNFASAIFAVGSLALLSIIIFFKTSYFEKSLYAVLIILQIAMCYETNSLQGILGIAVGIFLFVFIKLYEFNVILSKVFLGMGSLLGLVIFASFLGIGIFPMDLTQYTLKLRLYYWLAGIKMGLSNPIFGVGIDSYGDYFQQYRQNEVIPIMGIDMFTNNAHNPFVQAFATMGIIGLIAVLAPFLFALFSASMMMIKDHPASTKVIPVLFLTSWLIAFFSIENIAVASINWLLLGAVMGISKFATNIKFQTEEIRAKQTKHNVSHLNFVSLIRGVAVVLCFGIAWISSYPNRSLINEFSKQISVSDFQAVETRTQNLMKVSDSPFAREYEINVAAQGLVAIQKNAESIEVLKAGVSRFPRDFVLLDNLSFRQELIGQLQDARETRENVLLVENRNPRVWLYYAYLLQKLGEESESKRAFLRAVSLSAFMDPETKSLLPDLYIKFGLKSLSK